MNAHYRGDAFTIVRGASGSRGSPADRPVFVFQCYLDDSGTSGFPVVTMAGFLAHMSQWEYLEPRLDEIMNRASVPVFHAKHFYDTKPPFKTWSRIRKQSFAEELFATAHRRVHGYSFTLRKSTVDLGREKYPKGFSQTSAISVCFSIIVTEILTGHMRDHVIRDGLSFLVETGNRNNGNIEQSFHRMAKLPQFGGALRSISFISKGDCRAIQLADFIAFFSRRDMVRYDKFDGKISLPANPMMQIIAKYVPVWEKGGYGPPERVSGDELGEERHPPDS